MFYAIRNEPLPSLRSRGSHIPDAVEKLVLRTLDKTPNQRFQRARELGRQLRLLRRASVTTTSNELGGGT